MHFMADFDMICIQQSVTKKLETHHEKNGQNAIRISDLPCEQIVENKKQNWN